MPYRYYMFHKPAGCVTALQDKTEKTIMDYFTNLDTTGLRPVGRLDKDTEGLLLLTDDGKFLQHMTHPDSGIEKTYFFWAMGIPNEAKAAALANGIVLRGMETGTTRPAILEVLETRTLAEVAPVIVGKRRDHILRNRPEHPVFSGHLTLTEGRKHEVKRLLRGIGCYCIYLKRLRMGDFVLDPDLAPGEYKEL